MQDSSSKTSYYAVIFSSNPTGNDLEAYGKTADRMVELAQKQEGYLGHESYSNDEGGKITISYWQEMKDIKNWRNNLEHQAAQKQGRENWYAAYKLRIAKVERDYSFDKNDK